MDESENPADSVEHRSRRTIPKAVLAGAAVLGGVGVGTAGAANDGPSDVDVLNYALTLEHLEAAYYNDFLDEYDEHDVERSEIAAYFARPTLRYSLYQQIEVIRDHEEAHVDILTKTIKSLGGTPVEAAEYEFPYDSLEGFVALADRLESVGVSAYAGAAPLISNPDLIPPALSIHSVEANHSTFFNFLHLQRAAPNAFNPARDMDQVLPIAKQFIAGAGGNTGDGGTEGKGQLSVAGLSADADGNDNNNLNDEYIRYENTGNGDLYLSGWTVTDSSGTMYVFPDGFSLAPGGQVTLYTGSGTDTDSKLYWGRANQVWNNGADTMTVTDANGKTVLQRSYP